MEEKEKGEAEKNHSHQEWVLFQEALNETEATLLLGMLEAAGIPAQRQDHDPYVGVTRIIGGQAQGIDLYVPEDHLLQARALLRDAETNEHQDAYGDNPGEP